MALAAPLNAFAGSSWNPLRMTGTALPPQLLLMVKVVVVGLFLKGYHLGFPDVFTPFFAWMEVFPEPWTRRAFKIAFTLSATSLLFNRAVRANCLLIGGLFLVATLASKVYYRNAKVFVGVLFFLTGLQEKGQSPWLLWWQLAIMYFGAGLNKLLEADWRSGQYFAHFLTEIYPSEAYRLLAPLFPGIWLATLMCWSIFLAELVASFMFLSARLRPTAVWIAMAVHVAAAVLVVGDYGIYLAAVLASYLCCFPWPDRVEIALAEGHVLRRVRSWAHWLDPDRSFVWRDAAPADGSGIQLTALGRSWSGAGALGRLLLFTPAAYLVAVAILTGPDGFGRVVVVRGAGIVGTLVLLGILISRLRPVRAARA